MYGFFSKNVWELGSHPQVPEFLYVCDRRVYNVSTAVTMLILAWLSPCADPSMAVTLC